MSKDLTVKISTINLLYHMGNSTWLHILNYWIDMLKIFLLYKNLLMELDLLLMFSLFF